MDAEIDTLWALVAGLLLLLANVGAVVMIEGLTRRRRVLTVSARHIAGASGAVIGAYAIAAAEVPFLERAATADGAFDTNAQLWVAACSSVLLTTLAMAGLAERATVLAHVFIGVLMGAFLAPFAASARQAEGLLATIQVGDSGFVDTAAGSLFALAGTVALIGTLVAGPRLGRGGREGAVRSILGKSMPVATVGALLMYPTLVGVLGRPGDVWTEDHLDSALLLLLGGAVGAVVGVLAGRMVMGRVEVVAVVQGLLAGVVSTTGHPADSTFVHSAVYAAVGAVIAQLATKYVAAANIDDPVGVIAICGAAGLWGSLAVGVTNGEQFLAQLVGVFLIATIAILTAGLAFGVLRTLRLLRVSPDVEVAGLEP